MADPIRKLPMPQGVWTSAENALEEREKLRAGEQRLVLTNGCFDLLHPGHLISLEYARAQGDVLWVLLNSDESVKQLKGKDRPIMGQAERSFCLRHSRWVDGVVIFENSSPVRELDLLKPDVYVKSGDYTLETLDAKEREVLLSHGASIVFAPFLAGMSTTGLAGKLRPA